jgi:4-diphosphocytidyl-2-C-methyl-D-erythritol kinase
VTTVAVVRAQAKINLFLRILAREVSGYHGLETLFARVELSDEITVRVGGRGRSVDCRGADVGPAESNLAFLAADAYARAMDWPRGFAIEIDKRIPVGGGLGGGSADAGAVLRALNALAPAPAPPGQLHVIAAELGADVPFLTATSSCALAWGRGDRMLALPPLPARDVWLACFPFGVASGAAFGWVAESRDGRPQLFAYRPLALSDLASWEGVSAVAGNDFEGVVVDHHPQIGEVIRAARAEGALIAELTGSGSTVVIIPRPGRDPGAIPLPPGATLVRTRTAVSVEDVRVTG